MTKNFIFLLICAFTLQLFSIHSYAVKAYPYPVTIKQPDGTLLTIRMNGDEFHHSRTTADGYLVKKNAKGYFTYATTSETGEVVPSEIKANNSNSRTSSEIKYLKSLAKISETVTTKSTRFKSKMLAAQTKPQKAYPLTGNQKSLVILVSFADNDFTSTTANLDFQNLLNQENYSANGGTGSALDYFLASSDGKFSPQFDVVGPYKLANSIKYYGENIDGYDIRTENMIIDACAAADADVDFEDYDTDGDGIVDNIFVYYAGYNEGEDVTGDNANTIWPQRWSISESSYTGTNLFDKKSINDFACTSELKGYENTNMCGVGTFCHEFGHVLGLPDYYDTSYTQFNTLNEWDIMDYGSYNNEGRTPPTYSAYNRFYLGWTTPQQVSIGSDLTLYPINQSKTTPTNNQAVLLSASTHNMSGASPTPNEFFILEYRKKTGWDTYLPAEGLLIWHIDYDQTAWAYNYPNNYSGYTQNATSHMRVYLQPLSGSTITPGTAFTSGAFTPTTWSGTNINREITSITKTAEKVTFKLMGGLQPPVITTTANFIDFSSNINTPSSVQTLEFSGSNMTSNLRIQLTDQNNFEIKLSTSGVWSKSITVIPVQGVLSGTVQIRLNPLVSGVITSQLVLSSTGATNVSFNLKGTAFDPTAPTIYVGRIENLVEFPNTNINTVKIKTLNIKTTDITNNISLLITGNDASSFSVSKSSISKDSINSADGFNITITYLPTTYGLHTATLTISGGGLNPDKVINLRGYGL